MPILVATHGMPLITGVLTGARHWLVYGLAMKPDTQVCAPAAGASAVKASVSAPAHAACARICCTRIIFIIFTRPQAYAYHSGHV